MDWGLLWYGAATVGLFLGSLWDEIGSGEMSMAIDIIGLVLEFG